MRHLVLLAALLLPGVAMAADAPPPASAPDTWVVRTTADLIVLEKLRGQTSTLSVKAGQSAPFGSLTIGVRSCVARPPDLPQNAAAFLDVTDSRNTAPPFHGWVLANTPAVTVFEHPVYDIRLVGCR